MADLWTADGCGSGRCSALSGRRGALVACRAGERAGAASRFGDRSGRIGWRPLSEAGLCDLAGNCGRAGGRARIGNAGDDGSVGESVSDDTARWGIRRSFGTRTAGPGYRLVAEPGGRRRNGFTGGVDVPCNSPRRGFGDHVRERNGQSAAERIHGSVPGRDDSLRRQYGGSFRVEDRSQRRDNAGGAIRSRRAGRSLDASLTERIVASCGVDGRAEQDGRAADACVGRSLCGLFDRTGRSIGRNFAGTLCRRRHDGKYRNGQHASAKLLRHGQ